MHDTAHALPEAILTDAPEEHSPSAPEEAAPAPEETPHGFTATLLALGETTTLAAEAKRFAIGLGLAQLYGVALGARAGGSAFFLHALGVPAALLAVSVLGVPALYITLAIFDAPIDAARIGRAASRATATGGLVLAGLAPAAALYVVSSNDVHAAAIAASIGLFFGGAIALRRFLKELTEALANADTTLRGGATVAFFFFSVFAAALALRIWMAALPILRAAR